MLADILGISTADAATVVAAIVDVALFIITVWLACLTKKNVKAAADSVSATNKLIELQTEPAVHIQADWGGAELLIFVKNGGGGPARDIKFVDVKDDFPVLWTEPNLPHKTFKELEIVTNEIKELAPYQDILLAHLPDDGAWRECPPSEIFFKYNTLSGGSKDGSSIIDFPAQATVQEQRRGSKQQRKKIKQA